MNEIRKLFFYFLYRSLMFTWRVRRFDSPQASALINNDTPFILAHWHGDEYALIHLVKTFRLATMTSTSRDGDVVNYLICRLGGATSRGSSTRGGARALLGLIRLIGSGRKASVAVDGPRGPAHVVKPGVFALAKKSDAPVLPVGVHCAFAIRFNKSWNRAILPLPFAKIQIVINPPVDTSGSDDERKGETLAREIDNASLLASKLFAAQT